MLFSSFWIGRRDYHPIGKTVIYNKLGKIMKNLKYTIKNISILVASSFILLTSSATAKSNEKINFWYLKYTYEKIEESC